MARPKTPQGTDDSGLWDRVTRDVAPLQGRRQPPPKPTPPPSPRRAAAPAARAPAKPPPAAPPPAKPAKRAELPELAPGVSAGLDKRTAQRLKRGQLAIDGRLDLHGMTQAEAHGALSAYLAHAQGATRRCILVITGKGRVSENGGVLRTMVPRWLNAPATRARVLAIAPAQPKDGGGGALYVLLRRLR
jgi:DNA-nicking Smr family endonuclease